MTATAPNVIVIPANPALAKARAVRRQLRVAAYCRVSTDSEEQLTSYEAQKKYYTDKIMTNPAWTMAGIFADEGISGTQAAKRPQFLRMIRQCRQKKIDMVLVKSISRFARNTVDCLNYVRALRELGIAIIFEEQNINTLESDGELLITLLGAVSQGESEAISENVKWGKRQAMREGKAAIQYKRLYAYEKGPDGKPRIIPEQAEVVRQIYDSFLGGQSLRMIKDTLERQAVPTVSGGSDWSIAVIRGILQNEKYCGDVLQQKSFVADCISHKHVRNVGQLPMYLTRDHHEGIVSRDTFHAAKAEFARRNAGHAPSQKQAPTGRSCYSAKYALTGRLVCGECGTLYRRCVWSNAHDLKQRPAQMWRSTLGYMSGLGLKAARLERRRVYTSKGHQGVLVREASYIADFRHQLRAGDISRTLHGHDDLIFRQQRRQPLHFRPKNRHGFVHCIQAVYRLDNQCLCAFVLGKCSYSILSGTVDFLRFYPAESVSLFFAPFLISICKGGFREFFHAVFVPEAFRNIDPFVVATFGAIVSGQNLVNSRKRLI